MDKGQNISVLEDIKTLRNYTFDLFSMEKIIQILKEKQLFKDYILFQIQLPKLDSIKIIGLNQGETSPCTIFTNYFLTYATLHEFVQIFNNTNKDLFDYFCNNILERKELNIMSISKILSEREKSLFKLKNFNTFDFSHEKFFINTNTQFNKGSDIKNFTNCYNNNQITMELLEVFLLKDIHKDSVLLIKFPTILGLSVIDVLKVLCSICGSVVLLKVVEDSFFKDSFHVLCSQVNVENYHLIRNQIIHIIKRNKITSLKNVKFKNIIFEQTNSSDKFNKCMNMFILHLEILINTFLSSLQKAIIKDKATSHRNKETWKYLDYYNEYIK